MALVVSSATPLLVLDDQLTVQAASGSFCSAFALRSDQVVGKPFLSLGGGEWNSPQLRLLLEATVSGKADIEAYEYMLLRAGQADRVLIMHAHILDHAAADPLQLVLAVSDVTDFREAQASLRVAARTNEALVEEKHVLLQELNHRVANSLQIIASILMQRVRNVQSEETREHLRDAHHRVMSVATMQRLLAATATTKVALRLYLTDLCESIAASMIADPARLQLNVIVDDTIMDPDQSVSLGLIVTELAINALKHAFPDQNKVGQIDIGFASSGTGWALTVADNGVGLPANHADKKPGLGTGIVKALAGQLSATVAVTAANPGTCVTVSRSNDTPAKAPAGAV
ncbi:MAG: histidine kinase dimerization/phosphoacceptor domain -containing protein [Novosphingobium sp.]|uniref:sensor histidine kinase n=1 Tax=Novosphingobium sp. TaxID=1874826 RepID=UPI003C7C7724